MSRRVLDTWETNRNPVSALQTAVEGPLDTPPNDFVRNV
jgi:hypothetical protein